LGTYSGFLDWGGLIWAETNVGGLIWAEQIAAKNTIPLAAQILFEKNLAKHISPSPKVLMGFVWFGGAIFLVWGVPQAHAWLCHCSPCQGSARGKGEIRATCFERIM